MSVYLAPPSGRSAGPDRQGWNRLSLNAHIGTARPQCALRPRDYPGLYEIHRDSRIVHWGGHGDCTSNGDCGTCPISQAPARQLHSFTDRVLVRLMEQSRSDALIQHYTPPQPWVMNRPDGGWGERGERWSWDELARLQGWAIGRRYRDEHGDGFWLERQDPEGTP